MPRALRRPRLPAYEALRRIRRGKGLRAANLPLRLRKDGLDSLVQGE
jgi:hypothetical protein